MMIMMMMMVMVVVVVVVVVFTCANDSVTAVSVFARAFATVFRIGTRGVRTTSTVVAGTFINIIV